MEHRSGKGAILDPQSPDSNRPTKIPKLVVGSNINNLSIETRLQSHVGSSNSVPNQRLQEPSHKTPTSGTYFHTGNNPQDFNNSNSKNQYQYHGTNPHETIITRALQSLDTYLHANNTQNPEHHSKSKQHNDNRHHQQQYQCNRSSIPAELNAESFNQDVIRINCDVNMIKENTWGIGVVAHDAEGAVVASATWKVDGNPNPTTGEAFAVLKALELAHDCCFRRVLVQSDCEREINMSNSEDPIPRSYLGLIVETIRKRKSLFQNCNLTWIRRNRNEKAHKLAQFALIEPNRVWLEEFPYSLYQFY